MRLRDRLHWMPYVLMCAVHLVLLAGAHPWAHWTQMLLMPALVWAATRVRRPLRAWVLGALFFSWMGDSAPRLVEEPTRFLVMGLQPDPARRLNAAGADTMLTSFVFRVRNIPAALYKAMGGFATNGVNMTKLESYMVNGVFTATQFYADIEGHPEDPPVARAMEELAYFTDQLSILGVYPADPLRAAQARGAAG